MVPDADETLRLIFRLFCMNCKLILVCWSLSSMMPTGHLPYSLQEGPGSPAYTHWLCGSNIRSHCSSSRPIGPRSHLCHRKGSPEKCSVHWNTWRRSHCTSFLKRARHGCEGRAPCNSSVKARNDLNLTVDPGRLIPLSKSLRDAAPFLFAAFIRTSFLGDWCCWWHWPEIPAESQTAVLPAARHLRFRGSSSEWSGQSA